MIVRRGVEHLMRRSLRRTFERVDWVGPPPVLPARRPVVAYANHHAFHDGYLMWVVARRVLDRPGITWMEEWDRFPFFAAAGALPFPSDAPPRRAATIRRTAGLLRDEPETVLVLFPEGRLHPAEEGVLPFPSEPLARLGRLLPDALWWPVGIHLTWRTGDRPVALLGGGETHADARAASAERIERVLARLRRPQEVGRTLLEGHPGPHRRWSFRLLRRLFTPTKR